MEYCGIIALVLLLCYRNRRVIFIYVNGENGMCGGLIYDKQCNSCEDSNEQKKNIAV